MIILKNSWFTKFAKKERISDAKLCEAVKNAEAGLIDADYGGGVIKQRIARLKGTSIYLFRASIASLSSAQNPHVLCVHSGFCAPFASHLNRS